MTRKFDTYKYLLQTLDPVHIGTGGMTLGGVDNTIVRETGTNLPKIPGSSLKGVIRSYAAHQADRITCAGSRGHCKDNSCVICYTFGTGEKAAGVATFTDARILLFPIHSMNGPIWITSPLTLLDASLCEEYLELSNEAVRKIEFEKPDATQTPKEEKVNAANSRINLNWLMLNLDTKSHILKDVQQIPQYIKDRSYLVSDATFSQAANSNLEVRTSVSIDSKTGTAEDKALFTYEAIPRACILWTDVIIDEIIDNGGSTHNPKDVIDKAALWLKDLGIGGMGSRGFGRASMVEWT